KRCSTYARPVRRPATGLGVAECSTSPPSSHSAPVRPPIRRAESSDRGSHPRIEQPRQRAYARPMSWDQLAAGVELPFADDLVIPDLHEYALDVPSPPAITDIEAAAHEAAVRTFRPAVQPGMTVAGGGGVRGAPA